MKAGGTTGIQRYTDGLQDVAFRIGSQGEVVVSDFNGIYAEQTMRGNSFIYTTTTAVSVVALGTAGAPTLWNPAGSGKYVILNKVNFQVAAVGTPAVSGFEYGWTQYAGAQTGTAAPVVSLTAVAPQNSLLGGASIATSVARFAPATITLTSAPTYLCAAGVNLGSTSTFTPFMAVDNIDGRIIIAPGTLFQIGASTASSTTFNISIYGIEIPVPLTA